MFPMIRMSICIFLAWPLVANASDIIFKGELRNGDFNPPNSVLGELRNGDSKLRFEEMEPLEPYWLELSQQIDNEITEISDARVYLRNFDKNGWDHWILADIADDVPSASPAIIDRSLWNQLSTFGKARLIQKSIIALTQSHDVLTEFSETGVIVFSFE